MIVDKIPFYYDTSNWALDFVGRHSYQYIYSILHSLVSQKYEEKRATRAAANAQNEGGPRFSHANNMSIETFRDVFNVRASTAAPFSMETTNSMIFNARITSVRDISDDVAAQQPPTPPRRRSARINPPPPPPGQQEEQQIEQEEADISNNPPPLQENGMGGLEAEYEEEEEVEDDENNVDDEHEENEEDDTDVEDINTGQLEDDSFHSSPHPMVAATMHDFTENRVPYLRGEIFSGLTSRFGTDDINSIARQLVSMRFPDFLDPEGFYQVRSHAGNAKKNALQRANELLRRQSDYQEIEEMRKAISHEDSYEESLKNLNVPIQVKKKHAEEMVLHSLRSARQLVIDNEKTKRATQPPETRYQELDEGLRFVIGSK